MAEQDLKITDKRMFTPDGELREEFRHLEDAPPPSEARPSGDSEPAEREASPDAPSEPEPVAADAPPPTEPGPEAGAGRQTPPGGARTLEFEDLVGLLAQQAAVALGDAPLPDGQSILDLRAAQMHIDLLDVLREKTAGNLTQQQSALLEELLYRLRLVYVEKSRESG